MQIPAIITMNRVSVDTDQLVIRQVPDLPLQVRLPFRVLLSIRVVIGFFLIVGIRFPWLSQIWTLVRRFVWRWDDCFRSRGCIYSSVGSCVASAIVGWVRCGLVGRRFSILFRRCIPGRIVVFAVRPDG